MTTRYFKRWYIGPNKPFKQNLDFKGGTKKMSAENKIFEIMTDRFGPNGFAFQQGGEYSFMFCNYRVNDLYIIILKL